MRLRVEWLISRTRLRGRPRLPGGDQVLDSSGLDPEARRKGFAREVGVVQTIPRLGT